MNVQALWCQFIEEKEANLGTFEVYRQGETTPFFSLMPSSQERTRRALELLRALRELFPETTMSLDIIW